MSEDKGERYQTLHALAAAEWITREQYDAGLMFGDLWEHDDPHFVSVRDQISNDLLRANVLDLACRVCRSHPDPARRENVRNVVRLAADRMADLRIALDLIALRFKQIELSLSREPKPRRVPSAVAAQ